MKPIDQAISMCGGLASFARLIGETQQTVNNWRARRVPTDFCMKIERMTSGKITCEMLRPDIDWADRRYLPEQQAA